MHQERRSNSVEGEKEWSCIELSASLSSMLNFVLRENALKSISGTNVMYLLQASKKVTRKAQSIQKCDGNLLTRIKMV
jgi:hypothetical protein